MSTSSDSATSASSAKPIVAALIGNPNTGKSTLFSALAGINAQIGNYPGVTVEKKIGKLKHQGSEIQLIDLPGTYSLSPRSLDEMVSVNVLLGHDDSIANAATSSVTNGTTKPDIVICIVDASNLERNFYLFSQVLELGLPTILVLNQFDRLEQVGMTIDVAKLQEKLHVPVCVTEAHKGKGIEELKQAIVGYQNQKQQKLPSLFPESFQSGVAQLEELLSANQKEQWEPFLLERVLLDVDGELEKRFPLKEKLKSIREEVKQAGCAIPAIEPMVRYKWSRETLAGIVSRDLEVQKKKTALDTVDFFLTHWFTGWIFFIGLMFVIFQSLFVIADPMMGGIDSATGFVADVVSGWLQPGMLRSLLVDGIIAGVGGVIIFLPQIVLLFLFIAILEDCGYMARAAFIMDKLMTKVGLSGKSFVPLMSSFACAVPGIMATRVIESKKDRLVTILIAPLMSCSARLPVYAIMIAAFVPNIAYWNGWIGLQGIVLLLMSSIGALIAIPIAWLLKKFWFPGEPSLFVMELPSLKWPSTRVVFARVYERAKAFLVDAGTLIFCASVIVWAAAYFPGDHTRAHQVITQIETLQADDSQNKKEAIDRLEIDRLEKELKIINGDLIRNSYLGQSGQWIEPAVKPLGWDWRIGVGVIASFPAREVIVATLGTIYSLGGDLDLDKDDNQNRLISQMKKSEWSDGTKVFNLPVALSIMVFFALCAQCAATLMVIKRETNSWKLPIVTFVYMTTLGYFGALLTYQVSAYFLL